MSSTSLNAQTWPYLTQADVNYIGNYLQSNPWGEKELEKVAFDRTFSNYLNVSHGALITNGTIALEIALRAYEIGPGDEVLIPALTWIAAVSAVVRVGATPILVDIASDDLCIDVSACLNKITPRTRAVIGVHLYDRMFDVTALRNLCDQHNLVLVEDCAHAHGAKWGGAMAGTFGDISTFSFQNSKVLTSGEGGYIAARDAKVFAKISALINCGRGTVPVLGDNFRMSVIQGCLLETQFKRLEDELQIRQQNVSLLDEAFSGNPNIIVNARRTELGRQPFFRYIFSTPRVVDEIGKPAVIEYYRQNGADVRDAYEPLYANSLFPQALNEELAGIYPNTERAARYAFSIHHTELLKTDAVKKLIVLTTDLTSTPHERRVTTGNTKMAELTR